MKQYRNRCNTEPLSCNITWRAPLVGYWLTEMREKKCVIRHLSAFSGAEIEIKDEEEAMVLLGVLGCNNWPIAEMRTTKGITFHK